MSKSIDEKVLALRFNNKQFDAGVDSSLQKIDKLNKGLKLDGASKGLEKVSKTAKDMDMSKMEVSIDRVVAKMGVLNTVTMTFIERAVNGFLDMNKKIIDTFAIKPVTTGFNEYELKMSSVQTIMNATGASIEEVNAILDDLNTYSDKTIYSFKDMTDSLAKFVNAGVPLKQSADAIKGISNEAAIAGASAEQASHAMYNFAQALSGGSVRLEDWKSISNATMDTVEFKQQLIDTAEAMGYLSKTSDGMYQVLTSGASGRGMNEAIAANKHFEQSLSAEWLTTDVLIQTLERYGSELTDIGKKGYAAAGDVKSFTQMLGVLEETAQSGWASTWQLVVGDLVDAKELWTSFTNYFQDIINSSSEARNSLIGNALALQDENGITGRMALWEGIRNVMESLVSTLGAVKRAFLDVFPLPTDQKLRQLIDNFKNFSEVLKNDEERLQKIQRTFRGVFAVLDMFVTTIRFVFRVATTVIKKFVEVSATLFFFFYNRIATFIENLDTASDGFSKWIRGIRDGYRDFIAYIEQLDGGLTIENFFKGLRAFGDNVLSKIFNFDIIAEAWDDFIVKLRSKFTKTAGETEEGTGKITQIVTNLIHFLGACRDKILDILVDITGSITPEGIMALGLGASLILLTVSLKKVADSFNSIANSIDNTFDRVNKVMKDFAFKLKGEAVFEFAKSIALLVGALVLLTGIDQQNLDKSMAIIAGLMIMVTGLTVIMARSTGDAKKTISYTTLLIGLSIALANLTKVVNTLNDAMKNGESVWDSLKIMGALTAGLIVVGRALSSDTKKFAASALSMIGFSVSLGLLIDVLDDMGKRDLMWTKKNLETILGITGILILVGGSMRKTNVGSAVTIVALVASLKIMLNAISELSQYDDKLVNQAVKNVSKIFAAFAGLGIALRIANGGFTKIEEFSEDGKKRVKKSSSNLKNIGSAILKMSASLLVIAGAIKIYSLFSEDELVRSGIVIAGLLGVFTILTGFSRLSGEHADKAGTMIQKMSRSLLLISGLIMILTLWDDPGTLWGPALVLSELLGVMGIVVALSKFAASTKEASRTITTMTVAALGLGSLIAVLSMIETKKLATSAAAISAVLGMFALLVASTGKAKKAQTTILSFMMVIGILSGVLIGMTKLEVKNAIPNAAALAILITSLAASMKIMNNVLPLFKGAAKNLAQLGIVVGELAVILGALSALNLDLSIKNAAALSLLTLSLAKAFSILSGAKVADDAPMKLGKMAVVVGLLAALVGTVEKLDATVSIGNAIGLGVLLMELVAAFKWLSGTDALKEGVDKQIVVLGVITGGLGAIVYGLRDVDPEGAIQHAVALGTLLTSIVAALRILKNAKEVSSGIMTQVALLTAVVMGCAGILGLMNDLNADNSIKHAVSLAILVDALAVAARLIMSAGPLASGGIEGLKIMGIMLGAAAVVIGLIGAVVPVDKRQDVLDAIDFAIEVLGKIGYGIGSLVGEIIGGVLGGISDGTLKGVGQGLSTLMEYMQPFLDDIKAVDQDSIDKMGLVADAVMDFANAGGSAFSLNAFNNLANGLEKIGTGVEKFVGAVVGMEYSETETDYAIDVMTRLAKAAQEVPGIGGLIAGIVGDKNIAAFGVRMPLLAVGLVAFCKNIKDIGTYYNESAVDTAIDLMGQLAAASKEVPNTGGWLGAIIGNNDMDTWAAKMKPLAQGLVSFCYQTKNIDIHKGAEFAVAVMTVLAKASQEIPNIGGAIGGLFTEANSMDNFASCAGKLGAGIHDFCLNTNGIPITNMGEIFDVLKQLYDFANTLTYEAAYNTQLVSEFGTMLVSLATQMLLFSTCLNGIGDLQRFTDFSDALLNLATVAETVGSKKIGDMTKFGSELVKFGKTSVKSFLEVFETDETYTTGSNMTKELAKGARSGKFLMLAASTQLLKAFLGAIDGAMTDIYNKGAEYGKNFVNGLNFAFSTNATNAQMTSIGRNTVKGLENGLQRESKKLNKTTNSLLGNYKTNFENSLEVASPSKWTQRVGGYLMEGLSNGIEQNDYMVMESTDETFNGFREVVKNGLDQAKNIDVKGIWNNVVDESKSGVDRLKKVTQDKGILDFGAEGGDLLTQIDQWYKKTLGFDDESILDKYGFGDIEKQIEQETSQVGEAIASGLNISAGEVGSGSGSVSSAVQNLSEQLQLQFHKHFDYQAYVHLGEQIGDTMAIAANGAIVDKTETMTDTMKEALEVAAEGIEQWKAWSEARQEYDQLAQNELLAGWKVVQEKYAEGTKERMEADKQVYQLQKSLVAGTYEYIKQQIEEGKYYETLTLEQELAMWEEASRLYLEDSEQRVEIDKEVYRIKKELREQDFQNAKANIERMKKLNQLSAEEEISAWKGLLNQTIENSDERLEIEEKITDVKRNQYQEAKKNIQHLKHMDQLNLAQELAMYKQLYQYIEDGSDDRMELDEKIYDLEKEIREAQEEYNKNVKEEEDRARDERLKAEEEYANNVKKVEEDLAKSIADLNKEYEDAVKSREQTLYQAWGLFDEVKDSDYDADIFMENLGYQVEAFESWQDELGKLAARGVDKTLIEELRAMGPQALEQLRAINRMTDSQLTEYQRLWRQKTELAHQQAVSELEGMKNDTASKIDELRQAAAIELEKYRQTWQQTMANIASDSAAKLKELTDSFNKTVGDVKGALDSINDYNNKIEQAANGGSSKYGLLVKNPDGSMRPANKNDFKPGGVYSQSDLWNNTMKDLGVSSGGGSSKPSIKTSSAAGVAIGAAVAAGVGMGIAKGMPNTAKKVSSMVSKVVSTAKSGLKIRSPSKVFEEIGEFTTKGFVQGLLNYAPQAFDAGCRIGNSLKDGVGSAGQYLQEMLDDELDLDPKIVPVLDIQDMENRMNNFDEILEHTPIYGAAWTTRLLDKQNEMEYDSKNTDVVNELQRVREDLMKLGSAINGMQVVMETGALVGQIANPLDVALGQTSGRITRERG